MKPDWPAIETRPATPDPDPLFIEEETRALIARQRQARQAERNVWLGLLLLVLIASFFGVIVLMLIASRPAAASRGGPDIGAATPPALLPVPLNGTRSVRPASDTGHIGTAVQALHGYATWYDARAGTAAAGPLLRHGDWRGSIVTVCAADCVTVRLTDSCWCKPQPDGTPRLIDLARSDFAQLASPSRGLVLVTIGAGMAPSTDMEGER